MQENQVEQLAALCWDASAISVAGFYGAHTVRTQEPYRRIARFIFAHADEYTIANLLAHSTGTCVERKNEP